VSDSFNIERLRKEAKSRFLAALRDRSFDEAKRELECNPNLPEESIHAACAIGDVDGVAYHLELDPESINVKEEGWTPLLYACTSRFHELSQRHARGLVACVKLLLDRGSDPNSFTLADPSDPDSKLPALYLSIMNSSLSALLVERRAVPRGLGGWGKGPGIRSEALNRRHGLAQGESNSIKSLYEKDPDFRDQMVQPNGIV